MDSDQYFRYGAPVSEFSYPFSQQRLTTCPEWNNMDAKYSTGNSPSSTLSSQLDLDTFPTLSNTPEQYSSTDNHSNNSPTPTHTSFEIDSFLHNCPSTTLPDTQIYSDQNVFSHGGIENQSMEHVLQQLEFVLMDHDSDFLTSSSIPTIDQHDQLQVHNQYMSRSQTNTASLDKRSSYVVHHKPYSSYDIQLGGVQNLLVECAKAIFENRTTDFQNLVEEAKSLVSINGDPIQRLGTYMLEGLVARQVSSGTNIYRIFLRRELESKVMLFYMQLVYDICPYLRFAYMAVNGAIAEAFKNEDRVHIIDFQISQGTQWLTLIQALASRPGGPPRLRFTGISGPGSKHASVEGVQEVGKRIAEIAERFKILFEFNAVPFSGTDLSPSSLGIRSDEALAVNFTLQLNQTRDESVDINNPRDNLLRLVKSLSPKITTLIEQESNTNTTPFLHRFMETMDYYSAIFDSLDAALPRDSVERINIEQHCLGKDIANIIGCEGKERIVRHELLGKWKSRMGMAGFRPYPLNPYVNSVIRSLLRSYSENYSMIEKDGAMLLGWKNRNLFSASAWC